MDVSRYKSTSSEAVTIETVILHLLSSSSRQKWFSVLIQAILSLFEQLRKRNDTHFQVTLKEVTFRDAFRELGRILATLRRLKKSSIWRRAGRYHTCVRFNISFQDMVYGRKRPNSLLAATIETQKQVQSLKERAVVVGEQSQRQSRGQILTKIKKLRAQRSLSE